MRVAIYSRVSTKEQEPENQLLQLREFCNRSGYTIYNEYIDKLSGGKADRPQFLEMFKAASQRKFDMVLVWSLDRFTREGTRQTIHYLTQLDSYGILFKSYTEQYLDTTGIFKDAIISLLAALANQEKVRLSERVKAGMERAKAKGKKPGRPTVDLQIALQVKDMKGQGMTFRKIAKKLNISIGSVAKYLVSR
jgi:DNA invertase Pin-like site-specific DNA recombinase